MTGGKKRSYNSKEPNVVLCLPLPYDCSIVVAVEAHYTLLILMEKENACLRAQKHKADSSYHGMTALGTAQGYMDRFTSLTENINVSTAHSSVKLNSCHYNSAFSPPLPPHGLRVPSTYPSHSHILMARTTSRSSHLPLRLLTVMQTAQANFTGEGKVVFFQYQLCVLVEVLHKYTFIMVPLQHWQGPRATLAFLARFLVFDWVQRHSERSAFGWGPVWISVQGTKSRQTHTSTNKLLLLYVSAAVQN